MKREECCGTPLPARAGEPPGSGRWHPRVRRPVPQKAAVWSETAGSGMAPHQLGNFVIAERYRVVLRRHGRRRGEQQQTGEKHSQRDQIPAAAAAWRRRSRHEIPMPGARQAHRLSPRSGYIPRNKPRPAIIFNKFLDLHAVTKRRQAESGQLSAGVTDWP